VHLSAESCIYLLVYHLEARACTHCDLYKLALGIWFVMMAGKRLKLAYIFNMSLG
jgi:hypothetical protein